MGLQPLDPSLDSVRPFYMKSMKIGSNSFEHRWRHPRVLLYGGVAWTGFVSGANKSHPSFPFSALSISSPYLLFPTCPFTFSHPLHLPTFPPTSFLTSAPHLPFGTLDGVDAMAGVIEGISFSREKSNPVCECLFLASPSPFSSFRSISRSPVIGVQGTGYHREKIK